MAYLNLKYSSDKFLTTLTPGFRTYINSNYLAEGMTLRNMVEAYYLIGAKPTMPVNGKLTTCFYFLNVLRVIEDVNQYKSCACQFEYKPSVKLTLNLNTNYGYEESTSAPMNRNRSFPDFYSAYQSRKINFTFCAYIGNQQRKDSFGQISNDKWWHTDAAVKYSFNNKHSVSYRLEFFNNLKSEMITLVTGVNGICCGFTSPGCNLAITQCLEGRYFLAADKVFISKEKGINQNFMMTAGLTRNSNQKVKINYIRIK